MVTRSTALYLQTVFSQCGQYIGTFAHVEDLVDHQPFLFRSRSAGGLITGSRPMRMFFAYIRHELESRLSLCT